MKLDWEQVQTLFQEHGCVIYGTPEIRWYKEAWTALEDAGLAVDRPADDSRNTETTKKLRAVCLLAMYLGIYQAAGKFSELGGFFSEHPCVSWYLDSLDVDYGDIWELARTTGFLDTDYRSYLEDEDVGDELLREVAMEMVQQETRNIYDALMKHYGGTTGLFVSLWHSRFLPYAVEPPSESVDSPQMAAEKLEVWSYVEEGMVGWWWG